MSCCPPNAKRSLQILARSMVRDLQRDGLSPTEIVRFTSELIELMSMNESEKACSCGETPCSCER